MSAESFLTYNFDELWEQYSDDICELYILTERQVTMILGALRYANWASRWTGNDAPKYPQNLLRNNGRADDLETALTYSEHLTEVLAVGCNEELTRIATALEGINASQSIIASSSTSNCGSGYGSGCAGFEESPPVGYIDNPDEGAPDGFEDYAAYQEYKCKVANNMVEKWLIDLNYISTLDTGAITTAGVAVGLLFTIPGIDVIAIVSYIIGLIAAGAFETELEAAIDNIDTYRCDYVSAIYNAVDAEQAKANVKDINENADPVATALLNLFVNYDWLNTAFSYNPGENAAALINEGDACDCTGCSELVISFGLNLVGSGPYTIDSEEGTSDHYVILIFQYDGMADCGDEVDFEFIDIDPPLTGSYPVGRYRIASYDPYSGMIGDIYDSNTEPSPQTFEGVRCVVFKSTSPFSLEFDYTLP